MVKSLKWSNNALISGKLIKVCHIALYCWLRAESVSALSSSAFNQIRDNNHISASVHGVAAAPFDSVRINLPLALI